MIASMNVGQVFGFAIFVLIVAALILMVAHAINRKDAPSPEPEKAAEPPPTLDEAAPAPKRPRKRKP